LSPSIAVVSYTPFSPLPEGGLFSVALSVKNTFVFLPGLFTQCGALCSPDFPPQLLEAMKSVISLQS